MVKLADKVDKTVVINILHMFKNIKENVNMMRIEVILEENAHHCLYIKKKKKGLKPIN